LQGRGVLVFAGIAAPERLAETLAACGANVRDVVAFPDHHWYRSHELEAVARRARALGAAVLVTSAKDAVRLGPSRAAIIGESAPPSGPGEGPLPIWVLRVRLEPVAGHGAAGTKGGPGEQLVDLWRAELRSRVDAVVRAARST